MARVRFVNDERGVADLVGSLLLVAVTVVTVGGLGAVVYSYEAATPGWFADLLVQLDDGAGGWGTGDENVTIIHRGGEPIPANKIRIMVTIGGATAKYSFDNLDGNFSDGRLTIGETWRHSAVILANDPVGVDVIDAQGERLVAVLSAAEASQGALGGGFLLLTPLWAARGREVRKSVPAGRRHGQGAQRSLRAKRRACLLAKARGPPMGEQAIANVVGAILVLALVAVTTVKIQTTYMPTWEEEREVAISRNFARQISELVSGLSLQVDNESAGTLSSPISMTGGQREGMFMSSGIPARLRFAPDAAHVSMSASELRIVLKDGRPLAGAAEDWVPVLVGTKVQDIHELQHLRIRINLLTSSLNEGNYLKLVLKNATGAYAGEVGVWVQDEASTKLIHTKTVNAAGVTLYDQAASFKVNRLPDYYWINAMADEVIFAPVAAVASGPFTIETSRLGLGGDFAATYLQWTGAGPVLVGGGGLTLTNWAPSHSSGTLSYQSQPSRYVEQRIDVENGAAILSQQDGHLFLIEPSVFVRKAQNSVQIDLTLPRLTGNADVRSDDGLVSVRTVGGVRENLLGTTPRLNLTITTAYPDLWASFLTARLDESGLSKAGYRIYVTPTQVMLDLLGPVPGLPSPIHDVVLSLRQTALQTTFAGG